MEVPRLAIEPTQYLAHERRYRGIAPASVEMLWKSHRPSWSGPGCGTDGFANYRMVEGCVLGEEYRERIG